MFARDREKSSGKLGKLLPFKKKFLIKNIVEHQLNPTQYIYYHL